MEYKPICCIIGAILINLTLGTFYSIGNLFTYVASYMREHGSPDVTTEHATWLTATFLLGQGSFIIVGSYIEQNFNSRVACIFGCILHCFSTFLTMWAINVGITAVILVYGFGSGLGCGSSYMASIIAAQKWFPARKGFFTGIIVAGFGFGGLIFTNLQTLMINPDNIKADPATGYFGPEVYERVPNMFMYMGIIFTVVQAVGCILAFPPPIQDISGQVQAGTSRGHHNQHSSKSDSPVTTIYTDDTLPKLTNLCSTFQFRIFYIIGLMMMLVSPGVVFVNSLGKRYGQSYINDDRYLATVVAVAAVANATGRLCWGYLTDRFSFSTCIGMKVTLFSVLIILFPFHFVLSSRTLYLIWMLGLFFGFSGTFVLFPVFVEQVFGAKYHGIIYGILYIFLAISSIITSIVIQFTVGNSLADKTKTSDDKFYVRLWPCVIIATAYVMALVVYILATPVKRLEHAIQHKKDSDMMKNRVSLANRQDLYTQERGLVTHEIAPVNDSVQRENSLGSIVKFSETPVDTKIRALGKS